MQRLFFALVLALGVAACSTGQPAQTVAALESGLTVAERAALAYVSLPRCPQPTSVCSDPIIVGKISQADNGAYTAIKSAQSQVAAGGSPDMTAATAALTAFQSIIATPAVAALIKGN